MPVGSGYLAEPTTEPNPPEHGYPPNRMGQPAADEYIAYLHWGPGTLRDVWSDNEEHSVHAGNPLEYDPCRSGLLDDMLSCNSQILIFKTCDREPEIPDSMETDWSASPIRRDRFRIYPGQPQIIRYDLVVTADPAGSQHSTSVSIATPDPDRLPRMPVVARNLPLIRCATKTDMDDRVRSQQELCNCRHYHDQGGLAPHVPLNHKVGFSEAWVSDANTSPVTKCACLRRASAC